MFQMIPLEEGQFSMKFSAFSKVGVDTVTKTLNVIAEGITQEELFSFTIDPSNNEKRNLTTLLHEKYQTRFDQDNKIQQSIVDLQPEFNTIIPGTASVVVEAIGNKFASTIHTDLKNMNSPPRLPQAFGNNYLATVATTIYTLHYLKTTREITADQETIAYQVIKEGYKEQHKYRQPDGSFSVWPHSPSSTWLTAFVAKVFCQAGRYIFVDGQVVGDALKWLVAKQKPGGSFVEIYDVPNRETKKGTTGDVPLTSFVLMAFWQCNCKSQEFNKTIDNAIKYLKEKLAVTNDYYSKAISTYALALYDTEFAKEPYENLLQMSSFYPAVNRRYWGDGKSPLSIEASSYVLLTQVLFGDLDNSISVMNFLNSRLFWVTQDTVAAIEALAEYSIFSKDEDTSLTINITLTSNPRFKKIWQFQTNNTGDRRQAKLTPLHGRLVVEAEGTGVGFLDVRLRYNIANRPDRPALCQFDVTVNVTSLEEEIYEPDYYDDYDHVWYEEPPKHIVDIKVTDNPKSRKIGLIIKNCSRYLKDKDSNMAVVDVGILTGYKTNIEDLEDLVNDPSSLIDHFVESGRNLIFYMKKIPQNKNHCFSFPIIQDFLVSNLESGLVRVYDYFNPSDTCSQFYRLESVDPALCVESICKCAEGSCPKDPSKTLKKIHSVGGKRNELSRMACNEYNYFFKVQVKGLKVEKSGFIHYDMQIVKVIMEGKEQKENVEGEERKFLARANCKTSNLVKNRVYYIMGRDQELGLLRVYVSYVYFIDHTSMVQEYLDLRMKDKRLSREQKIVQKIFSFVEKRFNFDDICDL